MLQLQRRYPSASRSLFASSPWNKPETPPPKEMTPAHAWLRPGVKEDHFKLEFIVEVIWGRGGPLVLRIPLWCYSLSTKYVEDVCDKKDLPLCYHPILVLHIPLWCYSLSTKYVEVVCDKKDLPSCYHPILVLHIPLRCHSLSTKYVEVMW